ncbi:hypothetical protein K437DRAFT_86951 [Tilletiaria anomala UBC 951]|uniref:Uncharacterized protein n=1 Tax=Tilletiaria anomala (strain ATCC 24038 / CBS 436.72 / UBC 951) TaxID=1037660 RepID=A0A066V852_TILAU|nr:uncharacterized protein K437DRAFT_86951 [Tilletiaria anomala UBC 951]KDN34914.1 hypothetical protein K437DRAFT_86951 [Tilletiaria anomala UBC 951]
MSNMSRPTLPSSIQGTACAAPNATLTTSCCTQVNGTMASQQGMQYCLTSQFAAFQICSNESICETGKFNAAASTSVSITAKALVAMLVASLAFALTLAPPSI